MGSYAMNLPPGFVLDSQPNQVGAPDLPPGFVVDNAPGFDRSRFDMVKGSGDMGTSGLSAFGRGAAQGVSVGAADELSAAAAASPLPMAADRNTGRIPNAVDAIAGGVRLGLERLAPGTFGSAGTEAAQERFAKEAMLNDMAAHDRFWTNIAGNVAGGAAIPAGAVNSVASGAKVGAGLGAAYGFNTGSDLQDRAGQALSGGLVGGALGGALGGVAGALSRPKPAPGMTGQDAAAAGERLGVEVPKFIATDSMATQRTAQGLRNVPFAGEPIVKATERFASDLGRAADDVSASLGAGDRLAAGATAGGSIREWITGTSKQNVSKFYDAVDNAINPQVTADLSATRNVVGDILARRQNARMAGDSRAVNEVIEAVQNSGGLNYQGIKDLRSSIGEKMSGGILPDGMSGAELKRIYGALTQDLESVIQQAGGARAVGLWRRANQYNEAVSRRREQLAKIVGDKSDAPAEQVFDRLLSMASDKGGANIQRLAQARSVMKPEEWQEVGSALISRMGRDPQGEFSPQRFVTAWGNLSDRGRTLLVSDKAHRAALEDLATLSGRAVEGMRRFGNPSGTAQNVGFAGLGAGAITNPMIAVGTVLGGRMTASALAQPATASSMAKMAKAYQFAVERPTAATYAALQSATRNFAATAGDKIGLQITPQELLRGLVNGPRMSPADADQEEQNRSR